MGALLTSCFWKTWSSSGRILDTLKMWSVLLKRHSLTLRKLFDKVFGFHGYLAKLVTLPWLAPHISKTFWLKKKSLDRNNPKTFYWKLGILYSQEDFSSLENVFLETQMCFSKPWNFLFWKCVEPTKFWKKIIISWI